MESFKAIIRDNLTKEIEGHEQQIRLAKKLAERSGRNQDSFIDKHSEQIELKKKKLASL